MVISLAMQGGLWVVGSGRRGWGVVVGWNIAEHCRLACSATFRAFILAKGWPGLYPVLYLTPHQHPPHQRSPDGEGLDMKGSDRVRACLMRAPLHTLTGSERLPRGRPCIFMRAQMDIWHGEADLLNGGYSGAAKTPAPSPFPETPVERSASNRWLRLFSQPNWHGCDWRLEFDWNCNIAAAASFAFALQPTKPFRSWIPPLSWQGKTKSCSLIAEWRSTYISDTSKENMELHQVQLFQDLKLTPICCTNGLNMSQWVNV